MKEEELEEQKDEEKEEVEGAAAAPHQHGYSLSWRDPAAVMQQQLLNPAYAGRWQTPPEAQAANWELIIPRAFYLQKIAWVRRPPPDPDALLLVYPSVFLLTASGPPFPLLSLLVHLWWPLLPGRSRHVGAGHRQRETRVRVQQAGTAVGAGRSHVCAVEGYRRAGVGDTAASVAPLVRVPGVALALSARVPGRPPRCGGGSGAADGRAGRRHCNAPRHLLPRRRRRIERTILPRRRVARGSPFTLTLSSGRYFGPNPAVFPPAGYAPLQWDATNLLAAPARRPPSWLLTGEDPWLCFVREEAATRGCDYMLCGFHWSSDDMTMKKFSPMRGAERRCSYSQNSALKVRAPAALSVSPLILGARWKARI